MLEQDPREVPEWVEIPEHVKKPGCGPRVVLGEPGTGKTELALSLMVHRLREGMDASAGIILVPNRAAANRLRDQLALRSNITFSAPVIRTFAGFAYDLLSQAWEAGALPGVATAPRLLSGAEQDTLIEELLDGHQKNGGGPAWPESLGDAPRTRGFRGELREFMDRADEFSASTEEILGAGRELDVPEWEAAAQFLQEFRDVASLQHAEAFAPAELTMQAIAVLESDIEFAEKFLAGLELVIVDDAQEATPSQHRLINLLMQTPSNAGARDVIALACPDTVVQGFRGARADLVDELMAAAKQHTGDHAVTVLETPTRMSRGIHSVYRAIVNRLPAIGADALRQSHEASFDATADISLVSSVADEHRLLARHVIDAHLRRAVPYEEIAVIARNQEHVSRLARALELNGIATELPPASRPLKEEPAVAPLLEMARMALLRAEVGPRNASREANKVNAARAATVERLLLGRYGAVTSIDIRRIRQDLLGHDRLVDAHLYNKEDGTGLKPPTSDELLGNLLDADYTEEEYQRWGAAGYAALRLKGMITATREHLEGPTTPATVLWSLWENARMAEAWRDTALSGTSLRSSRAHRDLDAVMALFQAAERFAEQNPKGSVIRFIESLEDHDIPMDSLAQRGASSGRVKVLTPAAAAGTEYNTVIIAGLQEGVWPSTGLRGQLLRSQDLAAVLEYGPATLHSTTVADKLKAVRIDELRQLASAVSRAREQLYVTAVMDQDITPSTFIDAMRGPHADRLKPIEVPRPATLASLVAMLRRTAEAGDNAQLIDDAATVLGFLSTSEEPVRGAAPEEWWGLAPLSSENPVTAPGYEIKVSGSKVEDAIERPQTWFMRASGGVRPTDFARSLGTLIHAIAERFPEADFDSMKHRLASAWEELSFESEWESQREHERAEQMLHKFSSYVATQPRLSAKEEHGFKVPLPPAEGDRNPISISGSIDRIDLDDNGRPTITDLKTGKNLPTQEAVKTHDQLRTYQLAVIHGALKELTQIPEEHRNRPAGGRIVGLGGTAKGPALREQESIVETKQVQDAEQRVREAAAIMSAADFLARHLPGGFPCANPGTCPLCSSGRQVTHP